MAKRLPPSVKAFRASQRAFARSARKDARERQKAAQRAQKEAQRTLKKLKKIALPPRGSPLRGPALYARRVASALARGRTRQQARGHRAGEARERRHRVAMTYDTTPSSLTVERRVLAMYGLTHASDRGRVIAEFTRKQPEFAIKVAEVVSERRAAVAQGFPRLTNAEWMAEFDYILMGYDGKDEIPEEMFWYNHPEDN